MAALRTLLGNKDGIDMENSANNENKPMVSIIVPIYNAEEALARCIDSILGQDYRDFELMLIDDGSKDGSPAICDSYGEKDSRVKVIHKPNSGVSDTRNLGLKLARGRYIQFVDSDDWISHDATAELVEACETYHCDMAICDFYRVVGKRVQQKGNIDAEGVFSREEYAGYMMDDPADFYYGVLWNKLYRRDIIEAHGISMNPQVSWCEDFMFNLEYVIHAKTFTAVQKPLYYYVKTKGSLVSQSMSIPKLIRMKAAVFEYYNRFYKNVFSEEEYQKARIKVYGFLIDGAGDGFSPVESSAKLPDSSKKLCEELILNKGMAGAWYRYGKLFLKLTETAAMRYDVGSDEIRLLMCIEGLKDTYTRAELADMLDLGFGGLTKCLTTLSLKKLIRYKDVVPSDRDYSLLAPHTLSFEFLPASRPLMEELHGAEDKLKEICLSKLSEAEKKQFVEMLEKVHGTVNKYLQG